MSDTIKLASVFVFPTLLQLEDGDERVKTTPKTSILIPCLEDLNKSSDERQGLSTQSRLG